MKVNGKQYSPTNTIPSNNFHFDTNNVEDKFTYFSIPKTEKIRLIEFSFTKYKFIKEINKKNDKLEVNLEIPNSGYLVIRQPYDNNWIGKINSETIDPTKIDGHWLGFSLKKGINKVELEYSLNKYFLNNISVILYYLSCIYIFYFLIFRKQTNDKY